MVDASIDEEACSDAQLLVSVNGKNNICGQQKTGSGALSCESIFEMIEVRLFFNRENLSCGLVQLWNFTPIFFAYMCI